jgi:hypothetical protein
LGCSSASFSDKTRVALFITPLDSNSHYLP